MSESDDAYEVARRLIAETKATGETELLLDREDLRALVALPPEIGELNHLLSLSLNGTQVSDLTPLGGLTGLIGLKLRRTPVSDLTPLSRHQNLQFLWVHHSEVRDLAPLAGLTNLQSLRVSHTHVSDLDSIADLTKLTRLTLDFTQVSDLTPIKSFTGLASLGFTKTQVRELSPIAGLRALTSLWLGSTEVEDITPLANLTSLTQLHLHDTKVTNLAPLGGLARLSSLSLDRVPVIDLLPLLELTNLGVGDEGDGLTFVGSGASRVDPTISKIATLRDKGVRVQTLFTYLKASRTPGAAPSTPDPLLAVQVREGRLEIAASVPTEAERDEHLKRVLHGRLRTKANELAQAAGNRFPRLAGRVRAVVNQVDQSFEDVDLLLLHLDVEDLASRKEIGGEDGEPFTSEVIAPLDDVLRFSPGLTLGHPDVDLLNERVTRFRADPPTSDDKAAHDAMSRAVAGDHEAIGDRLRSLEERVETLPSAVAIAVQGPSHRNILWRVATLSTLGVWEVGKAVGLDAVVGSLSPQLSAFVVSNWPTVVNVASIYGLAFLNWFLVSVAPLPELSILANKALDQLRAERDLRG